MPVNLNAFYDTEFDQHEAALDATRKELAEPFARFVGVCTASIRSGNKLVLFGKGGGGMSDLCDPFLLVPSDITSRIQEMHITLGHMLCGALEQELGLI